MSQCVGDLKPFGRKDSGHGWGAWRIIPGLGYVVNNHGDRFRPLSRVVGPLPNGRFMAYNLINGCY